MKSFIQISIFLSVCLLTTSSVLKNAFEDIKGAISSLFKPDMSHSGLNSSIIEDLKRAYDFLEQKDKDPKADHNAVHCSLSSTVYPSFRMSSSDINYFLFTPNNPKTACDLQPNEAALQKCRFNPSARTIVLVHGWIGRMKDTNVNFLVKDKLLQTGDYNVVVANWTYYTEAEVPAVVSYPTDSLITFYIGLRMSAWITFLQKFAGAHAEMFHLSGHSLGAHVVSFAGKSTCNLGGITFMDAAGPLFRLLPTFLNPTYTDARITQAIHTSGAYIVAGGLGLKKAYAQIDYFPNGGNNQAKCYRGAEYRDTQGGLHKADSLTSTISCNHDSVYDYYLASLNRDCHFLGLICNSYKDFQNGKCNSQNSVQCEMNFDLKVNPNLPPKSKCYLNTLDHYPYCMN